jgi:hypothetical protein
MIILISIPLGVLCMIIAFICLQNQHRMHALVFCLAGIGAIGTGVICTWLSMLLASKL